MTKSQYVHDFISYFVVSSAKTCDNYPAFVWTEMPPENEASQNMKLVLLLFFDGRVSSICKGRPFRFLPVSVQFELNINRAHNCAPDLRVRLAAAMPDMQAPGRRAKAVLYR